RSARREVTPEDPRFGFGLPRVETDARANRSRETVQADSRQSARAMSNFCSFGAVLPSTTSCLELRHSHEAALIRGDHSDAAKVHTRVRVRLRPWGGVGRRSVDSRGLRA